ncbi:MAG TPA: hypothetical protein VGG37_07990, partial [Opitutaceae bacterium]
MPLPPKTEDTSPDGDAAAKPKRGRPRARRSESGSEPEAHNEASAQPAVFVPDKRQEPPAQEQPPAQPQQQPNGTDGRDGGDEQGDGQQGGAGHGQGTGRGEWQDRNSWRRNKRKRGRHGGGQWQQGPSGGPPRYPQQPPPPTPQQAQGDLPDPSRFADVAALDALANEISSGKGEPLYLDHLYSLNLADLTAFARTLKVPFEGAPNRLQLLSQIFVAATAEKRPLA